MKILMRILITAFIFSFYCPIVLFAAKPKNTGIFSIRGYGDWHDDPSLWSQSWLAGVKVMKYWSVLEPSEGGFDFSTIDDALAIAKKYNKKIIINIVTADDRRGSYLPPQATPQWVFDKGAKFVTMKYAQAEDPTQPTKVPVYWDPIYLQCYEKFVQKLAERYSGHPQVARIEMGVGVYGETLIDRALLFAVSGQKELWATQGLTSEKAESLWIDTMKKVIDIYKKYFTKNIISLLITDTALVPVNNAIDRYTVADKIANYAATKGVALQFCGMLPNWPYGDWPGKVLDKYRGKVQVYYEAAGPTGGFGGNCDPSKTNISVLHGTIANMKAHYARSATFWCDDITKASMDPEWGKNMAEFTVAINQSPNSLLKLLFPFLK